MGKDERKEIRKEVFKLRELEPGFNESIETYRRTQAGEEGRIISFSRALKEYRSGIYRGIYEYRGETRPNNGVPVQDRVLEISTYGTK